MLYNLLNIKIIFNILQNWKGKKCKHGHGSVTQTTSIMMLVLFYVKAPRYSIKIIIVSLWLKSMNKSKDQPIFDILQFCNCYFFHHLEAFTPLLNSTSIVEKFTSYTSNLQYASNLCDRKDKPTSLIWLFWIVNLF